MGEPVPWCWTESANSPLTRSVSPLTNDAFDEATVSSAAGLCTTIRASDVPLVCRPSMWSREENENECVVVRCPPLIEGVAY